jgi:cytosine/adenosine deaminase-related metal-dependent hydrolase
MVIIPLTQLPPDAIATAVRHAIAQGVQQCLRFGVTTVGDISRDVAAARQALRATRLCGVSYGEVVGMSGRRHLLEPRLAAALDPESETREVRIGVSPHAPYSIDADGYRRCLDEARRHQRPLTTHLAESPDEARFLADHSGPFARLWDNLGGLDASVPRFAGGPIRYAKSLGLLSYPLTLLAHVNYCDDDELELLAAGRASVVYCPRTHAYFGHPPHRWREMLARGINVCVGTDSRASAPDLNLVEDLRLLHRLAPEVPAQTLWEMATVRGARALGRAPWSQGWVVFPAKTSDPLLELLETDVEPLWRDAGHPPS